MNQSGNSVLKLWSHTSFDQGEKNAGDKDRKNGVDVSVALENFSAVITGTMILTLSVDTWSVKALP